MKKNNIVKIIAAVCSIAMVVPAYASQSTGDMVGGLGIASNSIGGQIGQETAKGISSGIGKGIGLDMAAAEEVGDESSGRLVALDNINISVVVPYYVAAEEDDGFVYFYTDINESMPYVIIGSYDLGFDGFVDEFTDYMSGEYDDLDVDSLEEGIDINGSKFDKVVYRYSVGDYQVEDTRLFTGDDNRTYMFGAKKVPELGYMIDDDYLEAIAGSYAMLAGGDSDYDYHVDSKRPLTEAYEGEEGTDTKEEKQLPTGGSGNVNIPSPNTGKASKDETESNDIETGSSSSIVFSEDKAPYSGTWCPFEDGFQLYLPTTWREFVLDDSQKAGGCLYQAGDANAISDNTKYPYIAVNYIDVSPYGYTTMDDIKNDMEMCGYIVDDIVNVNGIDCVSYRHTNPDLSGLMFYGPDNSDYVFAVVAYNFKDFQDIQGTVLTSLSEYEG